MSSKDLLLVVLCSRMFLVIKRQPTANIAVPVHLCRLCGN